MLQSNRNKLTLSILQRLRNTGMPGTPGMPEPEHPLGGAADTEDLDEGSPLGDQVRSANGLTMPRRKKKTLPSEDVGAYEENAPEY